MNYQKNLWIKNQKQKKFKITKIWYLQKKSIIGRSFFKNIVVKHFEKSSQNWSKPGGAHELTDIFENLPHLINIWSSKSIHDNDFP